MKIFVRLLNIQPMLNLGDKILEKEANVISDCQKLDFECFFDTSSTPSVQKTKNILSFEGLRSTVAEITPNFAKTTNFSPCFLTCFSKNKDSASGDTKNIECVVNSFSDFYKNYVLSNSNPKTTVEKLGTSLLIHEFFKERYDRLPPALCKGEKGKPFFAAFPAEISISHTNGLVCCAFAEKDGSPFSLGIDAEAVPSIEKYHSLKRIAENYFGADSFAQELFDGLSKSEFCDAFTLLWTKKESLVKMTGEGLGGMKKALEHSAFQKSFMLFSSSENKKYYISLSATV